MQRLNIVNTHAIVNKWCNSWLCCE